MRMVNLFTTQHMGITVFVLILSILIPGIVAPRVWQTMHLDDSRSCQSYIRNDALREGDVYVLRSDSWNGEQLGLTKLQQPECTSTFNFGIREVRIQLTEWRCDRRDLDMYLDVYEDCAETSGPRGPLKRRFNCSSQAGQEVLVESACATLYHYRGSERDRVMFFFTVEVTAGNEMLSFAVGTMAGVTVMLIVMVLVIIKLVCCLTGWDERLPGWHMTDSNVLATRRQQPPFDYSDSLIEHDFGSKASATTHVSFDEIIDFAINKPRVTFADERARQTGPSKHAQPMSYVPVSSSPSTTVALTPIAHRRMIDQSINNEKLVDRDVGKQMFPKENTTDREGWKSQTDGPPYPREARKDSFTYQYDKDQEQHRKGSLASTNRGIQQQPQSVRKGSVASRSDSIKSRTRNRSNSPKRNVVFAIDSSGLESSSGSHTDLDAPVGRAHAVGVSRSMSNQVLVPDSPDRNKLRIYPA